MRLFIFIQSVLYKAHGKLESDSLYTNTLYGQSEVSYHLAEAPNMDCDSRIYYTNTHVGMLDKLQ